MELITIRGKKNGGKTTTAALVNNLLVQNYKAKSIGTWLDKKLAPLNGDKGETQDFHSVLEYNGKVIVIISAGDDSNYLKDEMLKMETRFQPAVMVVCARFRDDNYTMRMLQKFYNDLYNNRKEVILRYSDESRSKCIMEEKRMAAQECIEIILQLCK